MKKRILCVFLLLTYLLVCCTLLSIKIEDFMTNRVTICRVPDYDLNQIPPEARIPLEDGQGTALFEAAEGTGWESGFRVRTVRINGSAMNFAAGDYHNVICFGTHIPVEGELALRIVDPVKAPDRYLAVYDCPVWEFEALPADFTLTAQSGNVQLFDVENVPQPFMERQAKWTLLLNIELPWTIYSLTEAESFLSQLPLLAILAMVLAIPAVLWLGACFLPKGMEQRRGWLYCNIGVSVAAAAGLALILAKLQLPGSMLPPQNILDISYYRQRLTTLMTALDTIGSDGQSTLALAKRMPSQAGIILIAGLALCLLLAVAQQLLFRRSLRRDKKG